jgi:formaldehyde-activating enzyme
VRQAGHRLWRLHSLGGRRRQENLQYNYEATKLSIARAMKDEPGAAEVLSKKATAKHPFSGV